MTELNVYLFSKPNLGTLASFSELLILMSTTGKLPEDVQSHYLSVHCTVAFVLMQVVIYTRALVN